ncbi:MAG TPA: adenylate/guanylate cyclase domain-containing protein [Burkholderiales bacterium]|jgi:adenylate cyclase|nr:adenylate/guanylate cyclase domain-containing protein [Burkholderiales bacterium]
MAEQVSEVSVLFADVSGSTKLYETAGDAVAHAAVEKCVSIMREKTLNAKGRVIKTIGDEVMSAFATADQAADAAIEMQSAISELPPVGNTQIGIRVGFNHGPVVERDGDVFGDAVNLAARLAGVATKGQIITARDTVMLMSPMLKAATRAITTIQVKGKAQEIQVYELIWQQSEDMTTLASQKSVYKPKNAKLRLLVQGSELVLSAERPAVALGRDASADLVIKERMASRAHGKIEKRLDKFILTDHSANGTFVTIEGDKEIVLRREEFTLRGHGWIAFGQSRAAATDVVEFFCE